MPKIYFQPLKILKVPHSILSLNSQKFLALYKYLFFSDQTEVPPGYTQDPQKLISNSKHHAQNIFPTFKNSQSSTFHSVIKLSEVFGPLKIFILFWPNWGAPSVHPGPPKAD